MEQRSKSQNLITTEDTENTYCNKLLPDSGIDPGSGQSALLSLSLEKFGIIQRQHCGQEGGNIWKVLHTVQWLSWRNSTQFICKACRNISPKPIQN